MRSIRCGWLWLALLLADPARAVDVPPDLTLAFMVSSGAQRSAWADIVAAFRHDNPDIRVRNLVFGQEDYKQDTALQLQRREVDLAFWFAGQRLQRAVRLGWLLPVDDLLSPALRERFVPAVMRGLRQGGHYWAVPVSYYPWGLLYRRSLFAALGLRVPATWAQFLSILQHLQAVGIAPLGLGAKSGWPAAAWFDYLDLRLNGGRFHRQLLAGRADCRDPRVAAVLAQWQALLRAGMFQPGAADREWDEVLPYLYRYQVGMVLAGSFALAYMPRTVLADIGFIPFPAMNARQPRVEDAPLDVLVRPRTSRHGAAARRFIDFLLTHGELLARYGETAFQLLPLRDGPPPEAPVLRESQQWLAQAAQLSFFFDRDATPALSEAALPAFRRFLLPPYDSGQLWHSLCPRFPSLERVHRLGG
ncbi:ABC transporter substrate-binding protein [Vogesella sp. LIG4]|uniref:ABC transporter substrate-binding protein n=1 Tax=Vogesella sp. LIG4 TaxID=1192162 RepID=UPI00081FF1B0|nr:extracellular solute-binding protein [Vogesella sp. LIG4]SCK13513.1 carbohydrate ABC transporter substrate-binding protein, CUT1 family [Vogesella sp. LIG4]